uniref:Vomeronasal type-1 receptor n=1 Tax=Gopherus agassizii TaxID=38772 RepID=A0A452GTU4_9SAUR
MLICSGVSVGSVLSRWCSVFLKIILSNLALSNLLVILTQGIPITLKNFRLQNTYNDLVCKITLYIYCVGRAMSICITSLLGCFQCILIVPSPCKWLHLRENLLKNLSSVMISFCHTVVYNFCCMVFPSHLLYLGNGSVSVTRDLFFLGIMTLSSCYLLSMFYQHGKQAKHLLGLHTKHVEIQAAKAVVALLIMYLLCFGLDSLFWVYTVCMYPVSLSLIDAVQARTGLPSKVCESEVSFSEIGCRSLMMCWRGFSWGRYVMASGILLFFLLGLSCSRSLLGNRLALSICFLNFPGEYCSFKKI